MKTKTPTVLKSTEKQIETSILHYLATLNIFCWKQNTVGVFDSKLGVYRKPHSPFIISGICDILGILPVYTSSGKVGKLLCIEIKVPSRRNNLTDNQKNFMDRVNANGGIAFVATSIEDVKIKLGLN